MINRFIALDVETANEERNSICQIGIVNFINDTVVEKWSTLVQPNVDFHSKNVQIHGIKPEHVIYSPTFDEIYPILKQKLTSNLCISHSSFDIQSISSAVQKNSLPTFSIDWMDSCLIAQKVWPNLQSHSLNSLAMNLNLSNFNHHDALEDAMICGEIYVRAIGENPQMIKEMLSSKKLGGYFNKRAKPSTHKIIKNNSFFSKINRKKVSVEANPNGPLFGKSILFTGSLSISRSNAASLAGNAGCEVKSSITKTTSYVVVGEQDLELTKGRKRSTKHRKAEEYISQGLPIKILTEKQFLALISD